MTAGICPGTLTSGSPWSSPDARLVLRAAAPRQEWLAARRTGIGSSDASAVIGVSKWTSPYEVWAEKRGLLPEIDDDNDAMLWGRLIEPVVADWWAAEHGIKVRRAGLMASRARPWQLASVDRLAACGGLVEIKTLSWRVAEEWDDGQTPDHAEAQTQHQLAVTGRSHAHVVGLVDGRQPLLRTIARDDQLITDMIKLESEFWGWVLDGTEPPIDGSSATTDALNARWRGTDGARVIAGTRLAELAAAKDAADAALAAAEQHLDLVKNEIRALLGDATAAFITEPDPDDPKAKPAVTWKRNGTFSEKQFALLHPDLVENLTVEQTVPVLDVARIKAEHPEAYTASRARVLRVAKPSTKKEN